MKKQERMELNKIYHIDCFDGFKQMEDKSVTHTFTSPPYNRKRNDRYEHHDDIIDDYFGWLCNVIDECIRVTNGFVFFNIQKSYYNSQDVFKMIGKYHDKIKEIIIWEKTNPRPNNGTNLTNAYEFFIVFGDAPLKSNTTYTKNIISTAANSETIKEHTAIMKREVADWFIKTFTKEGDTILDCFMGTGTTAIVCKYHKRNFIGFEIEKEYIELSEKKINDTLGLFA